jgi:hypothetical protein
MTRDCDLVESQVTRERAPVRVGGDERDGRDDVLFTSRPRRVQCAARVAA